MSDVAASNAVVAILIKLFPDMVARVLSYTEMFFGLGFMLGPALVIFLGRIRLM